MSPVEIFQATMIIRTLSVGFEDTLVPKETGLLDEVAYGNALGGMRWVLGSPGFRALWLSIRQSWAPELIEQFQRLVVAPVPVTKVHDLAAQWQASLAIVLGTEGRS